MSVVAPCEADAAATSADGAAGDPRSTSVCVSCSASSVMRRLELAFERDGSGLALAGRCWPPWPGAEIEVLAGSTRIAALLHADGTFRVAGLFGGARHVNVVLRGDGSPAIALLKLPVT